VEFWRHSDKRNVGYRTVQVWLKSLDIPCTLEQVRGYFDSCSQNGWRRGGAKSRREGTIPDLPQPDVHIDSHRELDLHKFVIDRGIGDYSHLITFVSGNNRAETAERAFMKRQRNTGGRSGYAWTTARRTSSFGMRW
jgi:hypothetical protein